MLPCLLPPPLSLLASLLCSDSADPSAPGTLLGGLEALGGHFANVSSLDAQPPLDVAREVDDFMAGYVPGSAAFQAVYGGDMDPLAGQQPVSQPALDPMNALFTAEELEAKLRRVPNKPSVGPDDVPYAFLKHGGPVLHDCLLRLYNLSWRLGVLPQTMRDANVIALFKGAGDPTDPDGYRPISMTSTVCRVFEHLVKARLELLMADKLHPWQAGFRSGRGCLEQINAIVDRAKLAMRNQVELPVAFLDIRKAFDRVWHPGLLYKLHRDFGISGRMSFWLRAFLSGRRLRSIFLDRVSSWYAVGAGVPQGSVLGPTLFLAYINDMICLLQEAGCDSPLFADDTAIMPRLRVPGTDKYHDFPPKALTKPAAERYRVFARDAMRAGLDVVTRWSRDWCVEMGHKKCALVVFHNHRARPADEDWSFTLCGVPLARAVSYKYLGVDLHEKLSWTTHFERVYKKVRYASWRVSRLLFSGGQRAKLPTLPVVRTLVNTYVVSSFRYGLPIWTLTQAQLTKLRRCIVTPLRYCLRLPRTANYGGILAEAGMVEPSIWIDSLVFRHADRLMSLPASNRMRQLFLLLQKHILPPLCESAKIFSASPSVFEIARRDFVRQPFSSQLWLVQAIWFGIDFENRNASGRYFADNVFVPKPVNPAQLTPDALRLRSWEAFQMSYAPVGWDLARVAREGKLPNLARVKMAPGLSEYLTRDDKFTASIRSRLRFDRACLNSSLAERMLEDSAHCSYCLRHLRVSVDETVEHVLLFCKQYEQLRAELELALGEAGLADHADPMELADDDVKSDDDGDAAPAAAAAAPRSFKLTVPLLLGEYPAVLVKHDNFKELSALIVRFLHRIRKARDF